MTSSIRSASIAAVLCSIILSATPDATAAAGYDDMLLGTVCVPEDFGSASGKYNEYGVRNDSTSSVLKVFCATPGDTVLPHLGGFVYVWDRHPSYEFVVWLCDQSADGNNRTCLINKTQPASWTGGQWLYFIPSPASRHIMYLRAEIPPQYQSTFSHVASFEVTE